MTKKEMEEKIIELMMFMEHQKNKFKFFRENWYNLLTMFLFGAASFVAFYEWKYTHEQKIQSILKSDIEQNKALKIHQQ